MRIGRWAVGAAALALAVTGCNTATGAQTAPTTTSRPSSPRTPTGLSCPGGAIVGVVPAALHESVAEVLDGYGTTCRNKGSVTVQVKSSDEALTMYRNALSTWLTVGRPLTTEQAAGFTERCSAQPPRHLPTGGVPLVLTWNLPGVERLTVTPSVLARLLNGSITRWDDPALSQLNPGVPLPATGITPVQAQDSPDLLGTVSDWLRVAAPTEWPETLGSDWTTRGTPTRNLAETVSRLATSPGAIAILPQTYTRTNSLPVAGIDFGAGPVTPTPEAATAGLAAATVGENGDLRLTPRYAGAPAGAYPLNLISYQVVCGKNVDKQGALLRDLLGYWSMPATQQALGELGFTSLPAPLADRVRESAKQLR